MTTINMASTRSYGEFEFWFASLKVGAIVVFIVVALSYSLGITSPTGPTLSNLYTRGGFMPLGFTPVLASVTSVILPCVGPRSRPSPPPKRPIRKRRWSD